jgi:hypothetical protein
MLNPTHIAALRTLAERSLAAGLIKVTEVAALGQVLVALEVEEKIYEAWKAKMDQKLPPVPVEDRPVEETTE